MDRVWAKLEGHGVLCYRLISDALIADLVDEVYKRHQVQYTAYGRVLYDDTEVRVNNNLSSITTDETRPIIVFLPPPPPPLPPPPSLGGKFIKLDHLGKVSASFEAPARALIFTHSWC